MANWKEKLLYPVLGLAGFVATEAAAAPPAPPAGQAPTGQLTSEQRKQRDKALYEQQRALEAQNEDLEKHMNDRRPPNPGVARASAEETAALVAQAQKEVDQCKKDREKDPKAECAGTGTPPIPENPGVVSDNVRGVDNAKNNPSARKDDGLGHAILYAGATLVVAGLAVVGGKKVVRFFKGGTDIAGIERDLKAAKDKGPDYGHGHSETVKPEVGGGGPGAVHPPATRQGMDGTAAAHAHEPPTVAGSVTPERAAELEDMAYQASGRETARLGDEGRRELQVRPVESGTPPAGELEWPVIEGEVVLDGLPSPTRQSRGMFPAAEGTGGPADVPSLPAPPAPKRLTGPNANLE